MVLNVHRSLLFVFRRSVLRTYAQAGRQGPFADKKKSASQGCIVGQSRRRMIRMRGDLSAGVPATGHHAPERQTDPPDYEQCHVVITHFDVEVMEKGARSLPTSVASYSTHNASYSSLHHPVDERLFHITLGTLHCHCRIRSHGNPPAAAAAP